MGQKLAIDFGTTNSVIAQWNGDDVPATILAAKDLSNNTTASLPPVVPSLIYIQQGQKAEAVCGQAVRDQGLDAMHDNRLFRNFKRGVAANPAPEPRMIDGTPWSDSDAARLFLTTLIDSLPYPVSDIEQLVLTAPVASFEGYLAWLNAIVNTTQLDNIRIVDESTAAALGYAVTQPGAVVMVFDFGGGTLDLSLVQLPESREKTGGMLARLTGGGKARQHTARVIAKAGRIIGGSDIDQWLLADVLARTGLTVDTLGSAYASLLTACEEAKIALSDNESATIAFDAAGSQHNVTISREELENLLEFNGFYKALRRVVDKVMHVARQRGIYKEDIHYVLMVGGTSLMPSVQRTLGTYFTDMAVRADKPFTAVAEGALQIAAGYGLDDYLVHSYGLRHLDAETGEHAYDEIVPMGSRYPTESPIEVILGAAHNGQTEIEFVIGEIDTESVAMIEVRYEDGQAVFVAKADEQHQQIIALNEQAVTVAPLDPAGKAGEDRLKAQFAIDDRRQLRLSVIDMQRNTVLLDSIPLVTLR